MLGESVCLHYSCEKNLNNILPLARQNSAFDVSGVEILDLSIEHICIEHRTNLHILYNGTISYTKYVTMHRTRLRKHQTSFLSSLKLYATVRRLFL